MNKRLIYFMIVLVSVISCKESSIETVLPSIPEGDKTVSVTLTNIPSGTVGARVFVFSITSTGKIFALEEAKASENTIVKIAPPSGTASFDLATFIPDDQEWTSDKSFTAGRYSRVTGLLNRASTVVAMNWSNVSTLTSASTTGIKNSIEATLLMNASATPTDTDFEEGEIVTLDATIVDNIKSTTSSVVYRLDNSELKSYNASPYKFQFNTKGVATGPHTIYLRATNALGNIASDSIKITISKTTNVGPSVSITGFANNAQFTRQDRVSITTSVSDPDDGIDKVEFKINNVLVATDITAPYTFNWDTFDNAVGAVTVEVTAFDKAGQSRSDVKNVTLVAPTNYIPRAAFASPANGTVFSAGATITFNINVTDTEGDPVNRVELWYRKSTALFDTFFGQDATSPYSFDFNTTGLTPGEYYFFVYAYDNSGRSTYKSLTITIN